MDKTDYEATFNFYVDQYEMLEGRARVQNHRDALGQKLLGLVSMWRKAKRVRAALAKKDLPPRTEITWRTVTYHGNKDPWEGTCTYCHEPAKPEQRIRYATNLFRVWNHETCQLFSEVDK